MAKPELTAEYVRSLLDYDPETGILVWRTRPLSHFATLGAWKIWNKRFPGKIAGSVNPEGYRMVGIDGRLHRAHRLILFMIEGVWPETTDHEHGDRGDNRLAHLRDVSREVNNKNACMRKDNKSGVMGVHLDKPSRKWQATIRAEGKKKSLGYFDTIEAAAQARRAAEQRYGFHKNHGRKSVR